MYTFASKNSQKGQVLLLVVLASVIALTVGLAAISRTITNTRVSTEETNSQKALSAAEAGVEEQINQINEVIGGSGNISDIGTRDFTGSGFDVATSPVDENDFDLEDGNLISQDEGTDVWIRPYPGINDPITYSGNTTLTIYWKTDGVCSGSDQDPAIEIVVIEDSGASLGMSRYALDTCASRNGASNGFDGPNGLGPARAGYNQKHQITVTGGHVARIIPLYNGAYIAAHSSNDLPTQGYRIDSTGSSGESVRKLRVYQGFPKLPVEFFPYNLFLP